MRPNMDQGQMRPPCLILIFLITIITILIIIIILLLILILILTIILIILIIIILILILTIILIILIIIIIILILIFLITIISLGSLSRRVAGLSPGNASVTGCRDGDGERAERGERCDSGALALALLGELSAFLRQRYIEIMGTLTDDGSKNVLP